MTKLTINICAEDDQEALRVLNRLRNMMDVCSGEDCGIHLNDAGYTSSHVAGSGEVRVIRIADTANIPICVQTP
jgi:hypothetical protein